MKYKHPLVRRSRSGRVRLGREEAGWSYVSFAVWSIGAGQAIDDNTRDEEVGLIVLTGKASVESSAGVWNDVGERRTPFEGAPHLVYLPPNTSFRVISSSSCQVARAGALASRGVTAYALADSEIGEESRGDGSARRTIRHLLDGDRPAERLLLVECITPDGHWSSYPPHKHDTDAYPDETYLEEVYYHRLRPSQGFALQRIYTPDGKLDEVVVVEDGTVVGVGAGYHPVVVASGYELYYLNAMAGPVREWRFTEDPDHSWVAGRWRPYGP